MPDTMIKLNNPYLYIFCITFFWFCTGKTTNNFLEFEKEINQSKELTNSKTINGINYSLRFVPAEILAIRNGLQNDNLDKKKYEVELNKLKDGLYFNFILSGDNNNKVKNIIENKKKYMENLAYLSNEFQNSFKIIIDEKDTLYCSLSHFEAPSSIKPEFRFFLAFDLKNKKVKNEFTLEYNDELFGSGPIKFLYKNKNIEALPKLKLL